MWNIIKIGKIKDGFILMILMDGFNDILGIG